MEDFKKRADEYRKKATAELDKAFKDQFKDPQWTKKGYVEFSSPHAEYVEFKKDGWKTLMKEDAVVRVIPNSGASAKAFIKRVVDAYPEAFAEIDKKVNETIDSPDPDASKFFVDLKEYPGCVINAYNDAQNGFIIVKNHSDGTYYVEPCDIIGKCSSSKLKRKLDDLRVEINKRHQMEQDRRDQERKEEEGRIYRAFDAASETDKALFWGYVDLTGFGKRDMDGWSTKDVYDVENPRHYSHVVYEDNPLPENERTYRYTPTFTLGEYERNPEKYTDKPAKSFMERHAKFIEDRLKLMEIEFDEALKSEEAVKRGRIEFKDVPHESPLGKAFNKPGWKKGYTYVARVNSPLWFMPPSQ